MEKILETLIQDLSRALNYFEEIRDDYPDAVLCDAVMGYMRDAYRCATLMSERKNQEYEREAYQEQIQLAITRTKRNLLLSTGLFADGRAETLRIIMKEAQKDDATVDSIRAVVESLKKADDLKERAKKEKEQAAQEENEDDEDDESFWEED